MSVLRITKRHWVLVFALLVALVGVQRVSSQSDVPTSTLLPLDTPSANPTPCRPGDGWIWTRGPSMPAVAESVRQALGRRGLRASVEAKSYGETDSCGVLRTYP